MILVLSDPSLLFEDGAVVADVVGISEPAGDGDEPEGATDVPRVDEAADDEDGVGLVEGDNVAGSVVAAQLIEGWVKSEVV